MNRRIAICAVLAAFACARGENQAGTDTTTTMTPTIALADVAGTWNVRGNNEAGDSLLSYTVTATADTSGWTITFPGRAAMPMHVISVAGDSIVTHVAPYESALRRGVQVETYSTIRLQNGQLASRSVARYAVTTADSVLVINGVGTRVP